MKIYLTFIFIFFINPGNTEELTINDIYLKDDLYYLKSTNKIFTGSVVGQFNGKIVNGKKEGLWNNFHQNGKIASKGNYLDGKQLENGSFFK